MLQKYKQLISPPRTLFLELLTLSSKRKGQSNKGREGCAPLPLRGNVEAQLPRTSLKRHLSNNQPRRQWSIWDCRVHVDKCLVPETSWLLEPRSFYK